MKPLKPRVLDYVNSDFHAAMFFLYMIFYVICYTISTLIYLVFGHPMLALLPAGGVLVSIVSTLIHRRGHTRPAALLRTLSTALIIFWTAYLSGGINSFPITFLAGAALGAYLVIGKKAGMLVASVSLLLMCVLFSLNLPPSVLNSRQMSIAAMIVQCINIPFVVLVGAIYGARADAFRRRSETEKKRAIESKQKTSTVMNAVRGAILSVNSKRQITEKNDITSTIFGTSNDLKGILIQLEIARPAELNEALDAILGESVLNFEVNEHCLPTLGKVRNRRYLLTWRPLVDEHDIVQELVIALIDNEDELKAKERALQSDIINSYMGILSDLEQDKSLAIINNIEGAISKCREYIPQGDRQAAFRELHTIKGVTRALKFDSVASKIHETESALSQPADALRLLKDVEDEFEKIKSAAKKLKYDGNYIKIEKKLVDIALQNKTERQVFLGLKYKTLASVFDWFLHALPEEAKKRNKPTPKLLLNTQRIYLTDSCVESLGHAMTHIISNALDHGIENEELRTVRGKPAQGLITIRASVSDHLFIRISDDGAGLAIRRIFDKAKALNLVDPSKDYSPNAQADFMFAAELSTRDAVSETAGRGVGMDAVRNRIVSLGGRVWAEVYSDQDYAPWELVIELPLFCIADDVGLSGIYQAS